MAAANRFTLCGNLRSLRRHFSTNQPFKPRVAVIVEVQKTGSSGATAKPSSLLSSATDFPLPGNVTTQFQYQNKNVTPKIQTESPLELLGGVSNQQKQLESLASFAGQQSAAQTTQPPQLNISKAKDTMECVAHDCPQLLKLEFSDLFPNLQLKSSPLTVVNVAQKTETDMGLWSVQMEAERDQLTADFISAALAICDALRDAGYWADFIDPSSGRPYLGPFTNGTLCETDGRLQNFGYSVEDLGCCKVINHRLWGRNAFIGTLFTTAPWDSPAVQNVLETVKQSSLQ